MRILCHDLEPLPPTIEAVADPPTEGGEGPGERTVRDRLYGSPRPAPDGRPWVLANMVAGLDGSLAVDGKVGELSSAVDRRLFVHLRGLSDAVMVGAGTARAEGYGPVRLPPLVREQRQRAGRPPTPPLVVVSRSLELDPAAPMFAGPVRPIVLTAGAAPGDRRAALAEVADVVVAGEDRVDLGTALAELHARDVDVLLTEGGPTLLAELVDDDLLDELCMTLAPVLGGDPFTMAVGGGARRLARYALASAAEADGELYLRYVRRTFS
jgi:riboflavin biosynthesis pyrimidine reductase